MAKIVLATPAADIRGKLGGIVFSRNTWGNYIRLKTSPVQPQTPRQNQIRAAVTMLAEYWRDTLTGPQRDAWSEYAEATNKMTGLGLRSPLNGLIAFVRFNAEMVANGFAVLTTAPAMPGVAPMPSGTITGSTANGIRITAIFPTLAATDRIFLYKNAVVLPQSRNYFGGPWTYAASFTGLDALPWTVVPAADVAIGQRWFLRGRLYQAVGKVGPPNQGYADVTA